MAQLWTALIRRPPRERPERDPAGFDLEVLADLGFDYERAVAQHAHYERALRDLLMVGIERLPPTPSAAPPPTTPDAPPRAAAEPHTETAARAHTPLDAVFTNDSGIVFPNLFIRSPFATHAANARQDGPDPLVLAIRAHSKERQELALKTQGAALDGSDILYDGQRVYIANTTRTNDTAIAELDDRLRRYQYHLKRLALHPTCPRLKAACISLGESRYLIDPDWLDPASLPGSPLVTVPSEERPGVNALHIWGRHVLVSESTPLTAKALAHAGMEVYTVDISEFEKIGGTVSRLSLLVPFEVMGHHTPRARTSTR